MLGAGERGGSGCPLVYGAAQTELELCYPPLCLSIATNDPRISDAAFAWLDSPLLIMEKLQVRSLWAAHLMSWTAFIMVLVWALAYQVKPWHLRDTEYLTASNMKWHYWR